jgi:integrase
MSRLYNEEIKERYLSQYDNEQTQKTIRNVFFKTELIESVLEKDLFDCTLDELGKCIENNNPQTRSVAKSTGRFISNYISWAIEERLKINKINQLKGVTTEWYDQFIDTTKKIHFSYSEFLELLEDEAMLNATDKIFLFLLFEGAIGERFSQIKEMKYSDIDFDNNIIYIKERDYHMKVDEKLIRYLEKSRNENTYYQYNQKIGEFVEKELLPSEYIFRNVKSPRSTEGQQIGMNVLYSRLHTLKDILNVEHLGAQSLRQSGMLWEAVKIHKEEGKLAYDELARIGEKYDYSTIKNPNTGEPYYNTFLMREFLNSENLFELYGLNIEIEKR